jgi:hypothetical protein
MNLTILWDVMMRGLEDISDRPAVSVYKTRLHHNPENHKLETYMKGCDAVVIHSRCYNSISVLACSTIDFHLFLPCAHLSQLTTFIAWMPFLTVSVQPGDDEVRTFQTTFYHIAEDITLNSHHCVKLRTNYLF